jgi:hypothetical protein
MGNSGESSEDLKADRNMESKEAVFMRFGLGIRIVRSWTRVVLHSGKECLHFVNALRLWKAELKGGRLINLAEKIQGTTAFRLWHGFYWRL